MKRLNLTIAEIDARFPWALIHADMHLADLQMDDVQLTVTRKGKLQWRALRDGRVWKQANWHADVGVWVRATAGFNYRGFQRARRGRNVLHAVTMIGHLGPIQPGDPIYLGDDGTVRAYVPSGGLVQQIGVAIDAPDASGSVTVLIASARAAQNTVEFRHMARFQAADPE
jgi:hypothetical protein